MYQITVATWRDFGNQLGLTDFSPETQDRMATAILMSLKVDIFLKNNDLGGALSEASRRWAALPQGPDLPNRHPSQPYMPFDTFKKNYEEELQQGDHK